MSRTHGVIQGEGEGERWPKRRRRKIIVRFRVPLALERTFRTFSRYEREKQKHYHCARRRAETQDGWFSGETNVCAREHPKHAVEIHAKMDATPRQHTRKTMKRPFFTSKCRSFHNKKKRITLTTRLLDGRQYDRPLTRPVIIFKINVSY